MRYLNSGFFAIQGLVFFFSYLYTRDFTFIEAGLASTAGSLVMFTLENYNA